MQCLIHGNLLANLDDLIEIIKHSFPSVFVCHFGRDICQQFKALFQGKYELSIGRFKGLDIIGHLFEGGFHLFSDFFFGLFSLCSHLSVTTHRASNMMLMPVIGQKYIDFLRKSSLSDLSRVETGWRQLQ